MIAAQKKMSILPNLKNYLLSKDVYSISSPGFGLDFGDSPKAVSINQNKFNTFISKKNAIDFVYNYNKIKSKNMINTTKKDNIKAQMIPSFQSSIRYALCDVVNKFAQLYVRCIIRFTDFVYSNSLGQILFFLSFIVSGLAFGLVCLKIVKLQSMIYLAPIVGFLFFGWFGSLLCLFFSIHVGIKKFIFQLVGIDWLYQINPSFDLAMGMSKIPFGKILKKAPVPAILIGGAKAGDEVNTRRTDEGKQKSRDYANEFLQESQKSPDETARKEGRNQYNTMMQEIESRKPNRLSDRGLETIEKVSGDLKEVITGTVPKSETSSSTTRGTIPETRWTPKISVEHQTNEERSQGSPFLHGSANPRPQPSVLPQAVATSQGPSSSVHRAWNWFSRSASCVCVSEPGTHQ